MSKSHSEETTQGKSSDAQSSDDAYDGIDLLVAIASFILMLAIISLLIVSMTSQISSDPRFLFICGEALMANAVMCAYSSGKGKWRRLAVTTCAISFFLASFFFFRTVGLVLHHKPVVESQGRTILL